MGEIDELVAIAELIFRLGDMIGTLFFGYLIWRLADKLTDDPPE